MTPIKKDNKICLKYIYKRVRDGMKNINKKKVIKKMLVHVIW